MDEKSLKKISLSNLAYKFSKPSYTKQANKLLYQAYLLINTGLHQLFLLFLHSILSIHTKHMEFKDRLKEARTKKRLSQSELANTVGVHVTNISRYERGENKPTTQVLSKLADALDVTTDFLMSGSANEVAEGNISDKELLSLFKRVNTLSND